MTEVADSAVGKSRAAQQEPTALSAVMSNSTMTAELAQKTKDLADLLLGYSLATVQAVQDLSAEGPKPVSTFLVHLASEHRAYIEEVTNKYVVDATSVRLAQLPEVPAYLAYFSIQALKHYIVAGGYAKATKNYNTFCKSEGNLRKISAPKLDVVTYDKYISMLNEEEDILSDSKQVDFTSLQKLYKSKETGNDSNKTNRPAYKLFKLAMLVHWVEESGKSPGVVDFAKHIAEIRIQQNICREETLLLHLIQQWYTIQVQFKQTPPC